MVLDAHAIEPSFIDDEIAKMTERRVAKTANRSVVGIMNEFTLLAGYAAAPSSAADLLKLSGWLAHTPCGPLYGRHGSPDRELRAFVHEHLGQATD